MPLFSRVTTRVVPRNLGPLTARRGRKHLASSLPHSSIIMKSGDSKSQGGGSSSSNAFAVLMTSSSKKPKGPTSKKRSRPKAATATNRHRSINAPSSPTGSRFVECPACLRHVLASAIDEHLERNCRSSTKRRASPSISTCGSPPRTLDEDDKKDVGACVPGDQQMDGSIGGQCVAINDDVALGQNCGEDEVVEDKTECAKEGEKKNEEGVPIDLPEGEGEYDEDEAAGDKTKCAKEGENKNEEEKVEMPPSKCNDDDAKEGEAKACSASQETNSSPKTLPKNSSATPKTNRKEQANETVGGGVFAKMMASSQQVFSTKPAVVHHFHLHNIHGRVSWKADDDMSTSSGHANDDESPTPSSDDNINDEYLKAAWSESVKVRPLTAHLEKGETDGLTKGKEMELIISSSIGSAPLASKGYGLVQRHSRLSVPVLKSMLQKSIRRRRPMPAVRLAMELADKSFGDLIRRLPIMMLEDSVLHPDLPFLVWLMVAESKGYRPPIALMQRVMRIVFEVASCPIRDPLPLADANEESCSQSSSPILDNEGILEALGPEYLTILRSMLLRVSWGGMKCDTQMLIKYEKVWRKRFTAQSQGPEELPLMQAQDPESLSRLTCGKLDVRAHLAVAGGDHIDVLWSDLPAHLHSKANSQSADLVPGLVTNKLEKLRAIDCCPAGVDFHCSSILESILSDDEAILAAVIDHMKHCGAIIPVDENERRECALGLAKRSMWSCSSGINLKRALIPEDSRADESSDKTLWDDVLNKAAKKYMESYISNRLV